MAPDDGAVGRRHPNIPQDGFPELEHLTPTAPAPSPDDKLVSRVDAFLGALLKPQYVYRMARTQLADKGALGRSAQTRCRNAAREIDALIRGYEGGGH